MKKVKIYSAGSVLALGLLVAGTTYVFASGAPAATIDQASLVATTTTPTISGTATNTTSLMMGIMKGTSTAYWNPNISVINGRWQVTVNPAIATGTYVVDIGVVSGIIASGTLSVSTSATSTNYAANSIGYIGCSNTMAAQMGYASTTGQRYYLWNDPAYQIGGGMIQTWASATSSYWIAFDTEVRKFGTPRIVWVQLCEQYNPNPSSYAQVQQLFANLKQHAPSSVFYVSPINLYTPSNICSYMGAQGQGVSDTQAWSQQIASSGIALIGPSLGPLGTSTLLGDMCHPNTSGMTLLGNQLHTFFDTK